MYFNLERQIKQYKPIITVSIGKDFILIGGKSCELVKIILPSFETTMVAGLKKSIRSVIVNNNFFACASYDGTGIVFKDDKFFDIIEGPETEIKGIAFSDDNSLIAAATRGKNVWLFNVTDEIALECTFEDHTQDVKGVKFINDRLFTYSYDRSIKVYEKEDDSWDMIKNVDDHECTVWDVKLVGDNILACDNHGYIYFYEPEYMRRRAKVRCSRYPIYSMCRIDDEHFAFVLNRNRICVMDLDTKVVQIISDKHLLEINALDYNEETKMLVSVCDGGLVNIFSCN